MSNSSQPRLISDQPTSTGPVECLGLIFDSDEARRAHFLKILRAKLKDPAFRQIEGFPIGSDEDILALSDPPYYTACPNPFIEDFIRYYGKPYDPSVRYSREPFATDVSEGKSGPIYSAHGYHTKVPHKAIMRYILHYTQPGDMVFDGFCGTGMTGIAAQLCGEKAAVEELGYKVKSDGVILDEKGQPFSKLGARHAVLNDLSPAATFISGNYNTPVDVARFARDAQHVLEEVETECSWMYETLHVDGKTKGRINYTVWSEVFACPDCGHEIVFAHEIQNEDLTTAKGAFPCPNCGSIASKNNLDLLYETRFDSSVGKTTKVPKRIPVLINYSVKGRKYEKEPQQSDLDVIKRIALMDLPREVPTTPLPDMQMARVGRMQPSAITHLHHFFLPREAQVLGVLWRKASAQSDRRIRNALLFFVEQAIWGLSVLNRYSPTHFSQVNRALSGVFYVASQISEVSPWYNLGGKLSRLTPAFNAIAARPNTIIISTENLGSIRVGENTVDYIFTDPPFGENIYYSDLNLLVESWHNIVTAPETEAIVDRVKRKELFDYQRLMQQCFSNYYRALKPGRWITVEFHNSRNSVWVAIQEALQNAGFVVADVRTLDKQQSSYQQVTSAGAVKQDLVITAYKPNGKLEERFQLEAGTEEGAWDFVRIHLRQLPVFVEKDGRVETIAERLPYLLYDRMVAFHVQRGVTVPLSAAEFYIGLEQRFAERDEMYFLPEQVAEYDQHRANATEIVQLNLFVTNESSAIQWLRQQLARKPQTYSDLFPQFTREIGGWQKHEKPLELRSVLAENFLIYDGESDVPPQIHTYLSSNFKDLRNLSKDAPALRIKAKDRWYVPDPNKAAEREKLREKALLKEFDEYRASISRRLKVFRLEAIRAGFKKAWQDRDYATIIAVAQKIPEDVLQEDQKLVMWYDQAITRTDGE